MSSVAKKIDKDMDTMVIKAYAQPYEAATIKAEFFIG